MKKLTFSLLFSFLSILIWAQETTENPDTLRKDALMVYMDADDYIKREIPFINYVRDIKEAQVYIISTSDRSGSGGRIYTYFLVGQNEFEGMADTIKVATTLDDTELTIQEKQVALLKMGLMRYVAKTPLSSHFNIVFTQAMKEEVSTDKWDSWVFRSRVSGYFIGQKSYSNKYFYGSLTANRVTPEWKFNSALNFSQDLDKFTIGEDIVKSENESKSAEALLVKSISDHFSWGGFAEVGSSTYSNKKAYVRLMPGIEYDLFPYSESTRRQFSILYSTGYVFHKYDEVTVYDKTEENLAQQFIDVTYNLIQKWGSVYVGAEWSNYFHDWSLNNLSLSGSMEFRIVKGLQFSISGGASLIHDQISLVKGGATAEEILTRQKELETQYSYYTSFGISYTFGSIYNNVVNPRFENGPFY